MSWIITSTEMCMALPLEGDEGVDRTLGELDLAV